MTHSKVYVEAQSNRNHNEAIAECKQLLEEAIDNGKEIFIERGCIPLSEELKVTLFSSLPSTSVTSVSGLWDWLKEYGWTVEAIPVSGTITLALVATKSNP